MRTKKVPDQEYEDFVKGYYSTFNEYPRFNKIKTYITSKYELSDSAIKKNLRSLLDKRILKKEKKRYKPFQDISKVKMKKSLTKISNKVLESLFKVESEIENKPINREELSYEKEKALIRYELGENMKISFTEVFNTLHGLSENRQKILKDLIKSFIDFDVLMKTIFYKTS